MRLLVVFLLSNIVVLAQQWQTVSPFPGPGRDDAVAFSIGDDVYLTTGNHGGFTESNSMYKLNRSDLSWSTSTPFPGNSRQYASGFSLHGKGYIIGGISESGAALKDVWQYDPTTENWIQLTNFPGVAHWGASATSDAKAGFLVGGTDGNTVFNHCWMYQPESDSWISLPPLPGNGSREGVLAALPNRLIYTGGFNISPLECQTATFVYDLTTKNWSAGTAFPIQESAYLTGTIMGNKMLVAGGWSCDGSFTAAAWLTDGITWEALPDMPFTGMRGMASCSIDGQAFFCSGLSENLQRSSQCTRIGESAGLDDILLFPNPANNEITISAPLQTQIRIHNCAGQVVMEAITNEAMSLLRLSLTEGLYIIEYQFNDEQRTDKLVITG